MAATTPPFSPAGYDNCEDLDVSRPESCLSTCSSSTSTRTLNREEMSFMSGADLDELCRQIFQFCDTNGDGYITREEILAQCDDDPQLIDSVMKSMDSDGDGRVSFEDFRTGLRTVKKMLKYPQPTAHSTPGDRMKSMVELSFSDSTELIYETEMSSLSEQDQKWEDVICRLDPHNHLPKNRELKRVWLELLAQNSALLPKFEDFILDVVSKLEQSRTDCKQIHEKMKRVLKEHNKEASEMDSLLNAQLEAAYHKQERKSDEKSQRLSVHFQDMLTMREEQIAELLVKEEKLQKTLEDKLVAEQNFKKERKQLVKVNKELKKQLADCGSKPASSSPQVITPPVKISNSLDLPESDEQSLVSQEVPLLSPSLTPLTPKFSSPDIFSALEPPIVATKVSPYLSLAAEVELALGTPLNLSSVPPASSTPSTLTPSALASSNSRSGESNTNTNHPSSTDIDLQNKRGSIDYATGEQTRTRDAQSYETCSVMEEPSTSLVSLGSYQVHPSFSHQSSLPSQLIFSPLNSPRPPTADQPSLNPDILALDCPSITLSNLITRREDLPRPPHSMPNRIFKVVFLGDPGVGKTSIIHRLSVGKFESFHSTIGLDYSTTLLVVREEKVVFQLWDTAGQERFHSTTAVYLRRADAFVVVYDVTDPVSFKGVKTWISLIKATLRNKLPVLMLMGNKCDQCTDRRISREEGQKMALDLQALFSETSALSGDNVLQSHTTLASLLLEREEQDMEAIRVSALKVPKETSKKCRC